LRSILVAAAVLSVVTGCAVDKSATQRVQQQSVLEPAKPALRTYALGTELTPEGAVAMRAAGDTFLRGGEIFLSVNVSGATTAQKVEVEWRRADGDVNHRDVRIVPESAEYASFVSGPTKSWLSGEHHVVISIDGRKVTELPFTVL
jgi:hypothetical protein